MAPLVCCKIHHLRNGFVTMNNFLDKTNEDDGLRCSCFYLHSNQLAAAADDQPILLLSSGMEKLIWALPKVYELYDGEVWAKASAAAASAAAAAAKSDLVQAVDKVIFSINIATTPQELQTNLEISVCGGEMYIDLKNYSWAEDEGIWRPCRGTPPLSTRPLPRRPRCSTLVFPVDPMPMATMHPLLCKIMWNKKTTALMIMCNLLFHFCARINMYILNVCHIINKLEMQSVF
jgi:hypothetical protein